MSLELERFEEMLIGTCYNSNESDIFEKIKNELGKLDENECQRWRKKGFDPDHQFNVQNGSGTLGITLLYLAAKNGRINLVRYFIDEKRANVHEKTNNGQTPLHSAARNGHKDVVEALLEKGANIHEKDNNGYTPLHLAAYSGHKDVVEALLKKGANVDEKQDNGAVPLLFASSKGHQDVVEALLKKGANVHEKDNDGCTPLHEAARNGHKDVVEALLEKGANVHEKTNNGRTPLHFTAHYGHKDVVEALLKKGANVHEKDNDGCTPLHEAARNGHKDVVEALLEKGADVKAVECGCTPLSLAFEYGKKDTAEVLIQKTLIQDFSTQKPDYLTGTYSTYWDKCKDEIKDKIVGRFDDRDISYLDLLKADTNEMASYVINDEIENALSNLDCKREFPIFGGQIKNKFDEGIKRRGLIDDGGIVITKYSGLYNDKELPLEVSEKVASYLSNADLKNLKDANENAPRASIFPCCSTAVLGAAIVVAPFAAGTVAAGLIPVVIAVVAVTTVALAVGGITYMISKPSTKMDETREEQGITGNGWKV
ncbi:MULTISPECIES: ankyrin repeat domain-containing protein [unclassified Wolbachia]|uniref:ankyrin repeat domain-containing protein n=1 Tax=unclassified Wolbachia TaxID=2640676 RepID=UPI002232791C|nr:ankyrin repeat domain-containing protein [Wolbachia endosymbiont (group A) of Andrena dorsata]